MNATQEARAHVAVRLELDRLRRLAEETPLSVRGWCCEECDHGGTDIRDAIAHEDAHARLLSPLVAAGWTGEEAAAAHREYDLMREAEALAALWDTEPGS